MAGNVVPGLEGIPIAESAISFVDGEQGILEYRGYNIAVLAEHCTFSEVCHLLLKGTLPDEAQRKAFETEVRAKRALDPRITQIIRTLPTGGHPMDALQAAVSAAGMCASTRDVGDPEQNYLSSIELIAQVATIVATFDRVRNGQDPVEPDPQLSHAANFLYMLSGQVPDEQTARILDICLILHADHTMNASTFTGRVVGSTLAAPSAVVSAAIGALSGPLHGGANERVLHMLKAIPSLAEAEATITAKMESKEKIMGFGHRVYKTCDPRATVLRSLANSLLSSSDSDLLKIASKVEEVVTNRLGTRGIYANVDFYSGLVYDQLGIRTDLFTPLFAIARVAGWLAHWIEQLDNNRIFRPRQIYTGAHGVPLERS